MEIGEKGMITAAKTMAAAGLEVITDPGLLKSVRAEFDEMRGKLGG